MLGLFSSVPNVFKKYANKKIDIDNFAFQIQYQISTVVLIVFTVITCASNYIGKSIECVQSSGAIPANVLNTYCFFIDTYQESYDALSDIEKSVAKRTRGAKSGTQIADDAVDNISSSDEADDDDSDMEPPPKRRKENEINEGESVIHLEETAIVTEAPLDITESTSNQGALHEPPTFEPEPGPSSRPDNFLPTIDRAAVASIISNGTYSVVENQTYFPYYGVGPEPRGDEGKEIHLWYQWVPFYLTFLAVTYYSGHFFWKKMFEKNTMKSIVVGMELLKYSVCDKKIGNVPSAKEREENLNVLAKHIFNRIKGNVNRSWTLSLMFIELYNLIHAAFAIYLTDVFLGGHGSFVTLTLDTAPEVFPTMTKCKFHKYGPSGNIQVHDALCVLAINIVNEKFFYILHWWMPFVLLMCVLCLFWRFLCLILFRNHKFNKFIFREGRSAQLDDDDKALILQSINFWDWVFLTYLASNMSGLAFRGFYSALADCFRNDVGTDDDVSLDDGKPLLYNNVETERMKDE